MRKVGWSAGIVALMVVVAACGGGSAGVEVEGVWARISPAMADAGVIYLQMTSGDDDRLLGVSVDPSIAAAAQVHETVVADPMGGDGDGMGAMMMQEVGTIDLPAGETVALLPGGLHIMLLGLGSPLESGQTFDVTLVFENAGEQIYRVVVGDSAP